MGKGIGRRRNLIVAALAALLVVPAILVATSGRTAAASTVLTILNGSASVARGAAEFAAAVDGDLLTGGDRVRTADASHAVITFFDGSTIEIEPASMVTVDTATSNANGSITISITQTLGRTWTSVQKLTHVDSRFDLKTPTTTAVVRGTGFITTVAPTGETTLQTSEGIVAVSSQVRPCRSAPGK